MVIPKVDHNGNFIVYAFIREQYIVLLMSKKLK